MTDPIDGDERINDIDSPQHIRDLRLVGEYKHCASHAPLGVYLIPEQSELRVFHGVIFVRRGLYRNGIFRFVIKLPLEYNSLNSHPIIIFDPPIFNPLIHPEVRNCLLVSERQSLTLLYVEWCT